MQANITVTWKLIFPVRGAAEPRKPTIFFNPRSNPGLIRQFGASLERALVPVSLAPTVTFHRWAHRFVASKINPAQRLPYRLSHPDLGLVAVNFKCREYIPGIFAITVGVETSKLILTSPHQLILLQQLNRSPLLYEYVRATLGLWASPSDAKPKPLTIPKQFPCVDVEVLNGEVCDDFLKTRQSGIVGALIRNLDYETMDNSIVDQIYKKNAELNKKTTKRLLLVDKQGILQIRSAGDSLYSNEDLRKVHDLSEIALVFDQLLDQTWSFRTLRPNLTDFSLLKVLDWIQIPQAHLSDSVSNLKLWDLLSQEFHLMAKAKGLSDAFSSELERKKVAFSKLANWWTLPNLPAVLDTAVQDSEGLKFAVIKDPTFRSIISADLAEAERSLDGGNYKATLILSGSVVEAILLALHKAAGLPNVTNEKKGHVDFAKASLADLIYSSGVNSIVKQTAIGSLLHSVREYRNLIHPDNQIRNSIVADHHNAEIALGVAKLLIREV